jgi:hypothetical protein
VAKKYKIADLPAVLYHDKDVGKTLEKAFEEFRSIFEDKTGIKWDHRLNQLDQDKQKYVYKPPADGKPVGVLPLSWEKPNEDLGKELDGSATISDRMPGRDCHEANLDLMDKTGSGNDAT